MFKSRAAAPARLFARHPHLFIPHRRIQKRRVASMIFTKQKRLLRISEGACLAVHIYIQECNVEWFTDAVFQELLQAIKPRLQTKLAELRSGSKVASVLKNSAFQVAYYIDKADTKAHILLQEPCVKEEEEERQATMAKPTHTEGQSDQSLFTYKALRTMNSVLVLVPEPFDANNSIALPGALSVDMEASF
ncbi:hypothetical protein GQ54DRAFT_59305 [Martensiomyces pterosporus]|nr:hypothetical protein GQ54DRAFT_59305 [Martensiomyces pterosporus]